MVKGTSSVWGSFATAKPTPRDLDYSIVVSIENHLTQIAPDHRRFFVASEARRYYGTDTNYLVIYDYPLEYYIEKLDFLSHARNGKAIGVVELSLRGEFMGASK